MANLRDKSNAPDWRADALRAKESFNKRVYKGEIEFFTNAVLGYVLERIPVDDFGTKEAENEITSVIVCFAKEWFTDVLESEIFDLNSEQEFYDKILRYTNNFPTSSDFKKLKLKEGLPISKILATLCFSADIRDQVIGWLEEKRKATIG